MGRHQTRRSPKKRFKSLSPQVRAQNERTRAAELDRRRTTKRAASMYGNKQLLMQKSVRELRALAAEHHVHGRGEMNKEQHAVGLLQKGWTP